MTGAALAALPDARRERRGSWRGVLRAAVRPEFPVEIYRPRPATRCCSARPARSAAARRAAAAARERDARPPVPCARRAWRDGRPPLRAAGCAIGARAARQTRVATRARRGCRRSVSARTASATRTRALERGRPPDRAAFARTRPPVAVREQRCAVPACRFPAIAAGRVLRRHAHRTSDARYAPPGLDAADYLVR